MRAVLLMYGNVHSQGMFYFARCSGAQCSQFGAQAWASMEVDLVFQPSTVTGIGLQPF